MPLSNATETSAKLALSSFKPKLPWDRFKNKAQVWYQQLMKAEGLGQSFGADTIKAVYEKKRRKVDEDSEHTSAGISVPDMSERNHEIFSFNDIAFPNLLILNPEDIEASYEELIQKTQVSQETIRLENLRSRSCEGLAEGRYAFLNRVRRSKELSSRRNSFSIGVSAHTRDTPIIERDPSPKRYTFLHSMSTPRIEGKERWPDRICRLLTNDQSVPARLKMFQYFSEVLSALQQRNGKVECLFSGSLSDSTLPSVLLPRKAGLKLESGAWSICKPGKPDGGEDAYFAGIEAFAGVADGVGEWGDYGCCPRQFACALMDGSCEEALKLPFHTMGLCEDVEEREKRASVRALAVLRSGFEKARSVEGCFGSSTSLVAGLDSKGEKLGIACLGDSSCIVLRRAPPLLKPMTITKRTREQQHFFNCPYQLSRLPEPEDLPELEQKGLYKLIRVLANMRPEMAGDSPEQADLIDISVKEGDLILLGTDGLFDNLFDHEIISLASLALSPYEARLFLANSEEDDGGGGPLDHARRLTTDWVYNKRAHPLALEPPSLLHTEQPGGEDAPVDRQPKRGGSLKSSNAPKRSIATPATLVAKAIAEAAFYRSIDGRAKSPFSKAARAAGGTATGGKQDDITVVACWVVSNEAD